MATKIGTLDFETDPFLYGRIPQPFAGCIWFPDNEYLVWDEINCAEKICEILYSLDKCTLYAHNGGKFDFHYLLPYADPQEIKIINGRIAKIKFGKVTLIDSFLLVPFALAQYKKTKISYKIFESDKRNEPRNKKKICDYLIDDCSDLYQLITGFHETIGNKLTIGSAAFSQMKELGIDIPKLGKHHDDTIRPYYYGGRCQAFKTGIFKKPLKYIDINSAYPRAMLEEHPHSNDYTITTELPKILNNQFIDCMAVARGCFPFRNDKGELTFPNDNIPRNYKITGWELSAALDTGTVEIVFINSVMTPTKTINFKDFVEKFYALKAAAKASGDKIAELAAKTILNSGYGKFCTNPEKFKYYYLKPLGDDWENKNLKSGEWLDDDDYNDLDSDLGHLSLWSHPDYNEDGYFNVATGASITGYVRAYLWRTICACKGVYYCDTDSIICEEYTTTIGTELGQWSIDGIISEARIAGKKLYSIKTTEGWKTASKGVRLDHKAMLAICSGETVNWQNDAPTFRVGKGDKNTLKDGNIRANFVKRKINKK